MSPRLLRPRAAGGDSDVLNYIAAVELADGQQLEQAVKDAIRDFILGCKTDGIWSAIKSSCIMMGARTLSGALTPLVGPAPTNFNFVSGDYDRKTGLVGNGSTKYLDTNRSNNSDPQDNAHISVYVGSHDVTNKIFINAGSFADGARGIAFFNGQTQFLCNSVSILPFGLAIPIAGAFAGASRNGSSSVTVRTGSNSQFFTTASGTPSSSNVWVFRWNGAGSPSHSTARISFFSVGESLDLSRLNTRVSNLVAAIGAAIP
jgi:hypothetical protein